MKKAIVFSLLLPMFFSSCSSFSGHLTRRYKSIEIIENDNIIKDKIEVKAYVIEKESNESIVDYSQFEPRIVVSIRNNSYNPADRIAKINVKLDNTKNDSVIKFLSCNKLTTEYQTLDLGKLNYSTTQGAELGGKSSIAAGNEDAIIKGEATVEGKLSANRSFSEEISLRQRMVAMNATITENELTFYQEGISGIDLTGNLLADITLGVKDFKVVKTYSFLGLKNDNANNIRVSEKLIRYANIINDYIKANITFEAVFREVPLKKGDRTISESDDKVKLYYGTVKDTNTVIIPINKPKLWILTADAKSKEFIKIKNRTTDSEGNLLFDSFDEANNFVAWLKSKYGNDDNINRTITVGSNYEIIIPDCSTIQGVEVMFYN